MKNIRIGTCVPGRNFAQWAPKLVQAGFECVTVNYHMEMEPEELAALPEIEARAGRHQRHHFRAGFLLQRAGKSRA